MSRTGAVWRLHEREILVGGRHGNWDTLVSRLGLSLVKNKRIPQSYQYGTPNEHMMVENLRFEEHILKLLPKAPRALADYSLDAIHAADWIVFNAPYEVVREYVAPSKQKATSTTDKWKAVKSAAAGEKQE